MNQKLLRLMTKYPDLPVIPIVSATKTQPQSVYGYWCGNVADVKFAKWTKYKNRIYLFDDFDALVSAMVCDVWIPKRFFRHALKKPEARFEKITREKKQEALGMFQDGIIVTIEFGDKPLFCGGLHHE